MEKDGQEEKLGGVDTGVMAAGDCAKAPGWIQTSVLEVFNTARTL